jgi:hypothetical protein
VARAKIRRAGALTFSDELLPIDLAIRDWARHDPAVAARLRRVDNRRMEYLRQLFGSFCADEEEIEGRAVLAFSLAIGYHLIAADALGRGLPTGAPLSQGLLSSPRLIGLWIGSTPRSSPRVRSHRQPQIDRLNR